MLDQGNNLCLISLGILITVCWTIYGEVKCQSLLGVKGFKFLYILPNSFPGRVGGFEANKEEQHRTETRSFRRNEAGMYTSSVTEFLGFSVAGGREGGTSKSYTVSFNTSVMFFHPHFYYNFLFRFFAGPRSYARKHQSVYWNVC